MDQKLFFVSKDANWQLYRNDILTRLAVDYELNVEVLTTGALKPYLRENERLCYRRFTNIFPARLKVSLFPGAIWYIIKEKPNVVLALNNSTQLTEYVSWLVCRVLGIKFIWWTHGFDHLPLKNSFLRGLRKRYMLYILKKSDRIVVFSEAGRKYLLANNVVRPKIFTAPNTLDTDKLLNLKTKVSEGFDKQAFLEEKFPETKISSDTLVLLFSGRLNKNKKLGNALRVVKRLLERGTDVRLMVVGDGSERNALEKLCVELQITDIVFFAGSIFEQKTVSEYFLASDLFLMPGYVGLAIVHAFAFELPVLTEDLSTHSPEIDYLKQGVNGFICKKDEVDEMASVIEMIYNDKLLLRSLKKAAVNTIEYDASIDKMLSGMIQAIV